MSSKVNVLGLFLKVNRSVQEIEMAISEERFCWKFLISMDWARN